MRSLLVGLLLCFCANGQISDQIYRSVELRTSASVAGPRLEIDTVTGQNDLELELPHVDSAFCSEINSEHDLGLSTRRWDSGYFTDIELGGNSNNPNPASGVLIFHLSTATPNAQLQAKADGAGVAIASTENFIPDSGTEDLGTATDRWDVFAETLDISGDILNSTGDVSINDNLDVTGNVNASRYDSGVDNGVTDATCNAPLDVKGGIVVGCS